MNINIAISNYNLKQSRKMLFQADSAHMLGMNVFLKRLVLQRGKTKVLERLRLYFGRLRGGSNGKSLWPGFSTIELKSLLHRETRLL